MKRIAFASLVALGLACAPDTSSDTSDAGALSALPDTLSDAGPEGSPDGGPPATAPGGSTPQPVAPGAGLGPSGPAVSPDGGTPPHSTPDAGTPPPQACKRGDPCDPWLINNPPCNPNPGPDSDYCGVQCSVSDGQKMRDKWTPPEWAQPAGCPDDLPGEQIRAEAAKAVTPATFCRYAYDSSGTDIPGDTYQAALNKILTEQYGCTL